MARSTTKEALALIKGVSASACKLRALIERLDKGLQQSITEKEIGDHIHQKFRQAATKKVHANFCDRKRLTKARVITTEEVIRLREVRERADAEKAAKAATREEKKKLKEMQGPTPPKGKGKGKKAVTISESITVHSIEPENAAGVVVVEEAEEEWPDIDDLYAQPGDSTPPPSRKRTNKAWEKAQNGR